MSEVDSALNIMFKSIQMATEVSNTALNMLSIMIKVPEGDPVNAAWINAINEKKVDVITCTGDDKDNITQKLATNNIPYKECKKMIFTFQSDRVLVDEIIKNENIVRPKNITIEEEIKNNCEKDFIELRVKSEEEAMSFKRRLDANNILYTVNTVGCDSEYKFILSDKDYDKLCMIKLDVAIDNQKDYKEIIDREVKKEELYKLGMLKALGLSEKDNDFIIVDADGSAIENYERFMVYKENNEEKYNINKTKDLTVIIEKFVDMTIPTVLTVEEYETFKTAENKKDFLIDKRRNQGIYNLSNEEKEILLKHEKERQLIEQKLIQSHPAEIVADMNDYNSEQPLIVFKDAEKENYEMNHDLSEIQYIDGTILNDAYMNYRYYEIEEPEIDYDELARIENEVFNIEDREDIINGLINSMDYQEQNYEMEQ